MSYGVEFFFLQILLCNPLSMTSSYYQQMGKDICQIEFTQINLDITNELSMKREEGHYFK